MAPRSVRLPDGKERMPVYCKHCGQPMKGGANFCGRCGEPLEAIAVSLAYVPGLLALCAAAAIHANGRRSDRN